MSIFALLAAAAGTGTPVDPDPPVDNDGFSIGTSDDPVWVPEGSLTRWRAARDNSDTQRVEVAYTGDSTSFGEGNTTDGYWPTAYLLRELSIADGYPDGGIGHYTRQTSNGVYRPRPIPYEPLVDLFDPEPAATNPANSFARSGVTIDAPGDWVEWRGEGRYARLVYARNARNVGNFTYSVDGVLAGTIPHPHPAPLPASGFESTVIDLGTPGLHVVRLSALGGHATPVPAIVGTAMGSGGTLAPGTYYYVATQAPTSGGETTPTDPVQITVGSVGQRPMLTIASSPPSGMSKVYRATSPSGPYGYVGEVVGETTARFYDDGTATPGAEPPTVDTAGPSGWSIVSCDIEWLNGAGIVWHRDSQSGSQSVGGLIDLMRHTYATPPPHGRRLKLAVNVYGINDQQQATDRSEVLRANLRTWVDLVRAAGASPVLCIPLYERANQKDTIDDGHTVRRADRFRQVHRDVAIEKQCTLVDLGSGGALPGVTEGTNPHLNETQYRAQAAYLWDNCLSL